MARFHIMHCMPDSQQHGLRGYQEVIDTLSWGLQQLGHEVSHAVNGSVRGATNIIFGAHMITVEGLAKLPDNSIAYSLEQARNLDPRQAPPTVQFFAKRFQVWDYSLANMGFWKGLGTPRVKLVPIGYAPVLSRIPGDVPQDIDVLIYGMSAPNRLLAFNQLSYAGLTVLFVSGLYGKPRDELIARSKLVLNVNMYDAAQIFEVVRVSYLLANRKAVIATRHPETFVEDDIAAAVRFTTMDRLVDDCRALIANTPARAALEARGFETMARRDIRAVLAAALG